MYKLRGVIEGNAPLLFGAMTQRSLEVLEGTRGTGGRYTPSEQLAEVAERYYWDEQGMYLPAWNFKKCLLDGCVKAGLKEGRASMMPFLKATVFPSGELRFGRMEPDGVMSVVGKRPPRTGGAVVIKYPKLDAGWRLPFELDVVDDRRREEDIFRSLTEAGKLVGLGAWRPEFGRFLVTEWERIEQPAT